MIRYINEGDRVPFGLSKAADFNRLRLPIAICRGKRYDIINDEITVGWWCLNLTFRFRRWKITARTGWHHLGHGRKFGKWLMP